MMAELVSEENYPRARIVYSRLDNGCTPRLPALSQCGRQAASHSTAVAYCYRSIAGLPL